MMRGDDHPGKEVRQHGDAGAKRAVFLAGDFVEQQRQHQPDVLTNTNLIRLMYTALPRGAPEHPVGGHFRKMFQASPFAAGDALDTLKSRKAICRP